MSASETPKRKSRKKEGEPIAAEAVLSADEMQALRSFVRYSLGSGHLTWWEEKFLSDRHQELYQQSIWLSDKQRTIIQQLKDKLNYDRQDVPLPIIDPDGVEENNDPDGWPVTRELVPQFEDDE